MFVLKLPVSRHGVDPPSLCYQEHVVEQHEDSGELVREVIRILGNGLAFEGLEAGQAQQRTCLPSVARPRTAF